MKTFHNEHPMFSSTHWRFLSSSEKLQNEFLWEQESLPFNELILSWNASRPAQGRFVFFVALRQNNAWSPWIKYAEWGVSDQRTFRSDSSFQDAVFTKTGTADAFRIKVSSPSPLDALCACTSSLDRFAIEKAADFSPVLLANMPRQSQMVLPHPRHRDLCSPTSTATAVNFLLGNGAVDPAHFAEKVHDREFDIYGNWVLNAAEAYHALGGKCRCHVERVEGFSIIHERLRGGIPSVVSVKGTLPGAPQPYLKGHLICVVGYEGGKVYCIDPAFAKSEETFVGYELGDFLRVWGARYNLAYLFSGVKANFF